MEKGEVDLYTIPLQALTFEAHNLLSCLLNTTKILLSEGPDRLPRDWRGLARLINISSERANSFDTDKTAKVINYWIQKKDGTATVGKLLEYVQKLDRYDIFDDFMDLLDKGLLIDNLQKRKVPQQPRNNVVANINHNNQLVPYEPFPEEDIITFDDKIHGYPQFYHAYVMYAIEDKDFVDEMLTRMRERGYKMCTEEDLLPDHTTTYTPVSRLISSERCHRIILVYSPDFLISPANNFYMDYAQAVGIEMKKPKIVPCMYRQCTLPSNMSFYHKLYYRTPGSKASYDFWDRLAMSIEVREIHNNMPRLNGINGMNTTSSLSRLNITELNSTQTLSNGLGYNRSMLALPSPPTRSTSSLGINSSSSVTQSSISLGGKGQKKKGNLFKNMLNLSSLKLSRKKKEVKIEA